MLVAYFGTYRDEGRDDWVFHELLLLLLSKRCMEMVGFTLRSFGLSVLPPPGPSPSRKFETIVAANAFKSRNILAFLKQSKVLGLRLMNVEEASPRVEARLSLVSLGDLRKRIQEFFDGNDIELQEPAFENSSFLAEFTDGEKSRSDFSHR